MDGVFAGTIPVSHELLPLLLLLLLLLVVVVTVLRNNHDSDSINDEGQWQIIMRMKDDAIS